MKSWTRIGVLALGVVMAALLFTGSGVAAGDSGPHNTGVPLPAITDVPWEVEHHVREGEFLYMLAGYYYQDGRKWNWIYEWNRDKLVDANHIYPGQVLIIRVPKGWSPPLAYGLWYDRMREQYQNYQGPGGPAISPAAPAPATNTSGPSPEVKKKVNSD